MIRKLLVSSDIYQKKKKDQDIKKKRTIFENPN